MRLPFFIIIALFGAPLYAHSEAVQYHWNQGDSYAYAMRIQVKGHDYTDVMEGTPIYTVRSSGEITTLVAYGVLFPERHAHDGSLLDRSGPLTLGPVRLVLPNPGTEIRVNSTGQVLHTAGDEPLYFLLGDLSRLLVPPFGAHGGPTWQVEGDCRLEATTSADNPPGWSAFPAHENLTYTLEGNAGADTNIRLHYELRTRDSSAQTHPVQVNGDGRLVFDTRLGLLQSLELQTTLRSPEDGGKLLIQYSVRKLEGKERDAAFQPLVVGAGVGTLLDRETLAATLADLHSAERWSRLDAAELLSHAEPAERRAEVAKALQSLLSDPDPFVRQAAVRALGKWGSRENVPSLIPLLDSSNFALRWAAIETLAQIKDPRAAFALTRRLMDPTDRSEASHGLESLGPPAATAVASLLTDEDWRIRLEACHILQTIGHRSNLAPLRAAVHDPNGLVAASAQYALDASAMRP